MENEVERVVLLGAGGKMGHRIAEKLSSAQYDLYCVEPNPAGRQQLLEAGHIVVEAEEVIPRADIVILAIPDKLIGDVSSSIAETLQSGTIVVCLDPAAPLAGKLPPRKDVSFFITHPCHPSVFNNEDDPVARNDRFGGVARQAIVCALMQGPEADFDRGEQLACNIFAPVSRSHRVTVEQMAVLEPALAETVSITLLKTIREAMDEAIACGVPAEAARDFILGHIGVSLAIVFNEIDANFSDGAIKAVERGSKALLKPNWKDVFLMENIMTEIRQITEGQ
jgi:D-apionate oxidoisomerase